MELGGCATTLIVKVDGRKLPRRACRPLPPRLLNYQESIWWQNKIINLYNRIIIIGILVSPLPYLGVCPQHSKLPLSQVSF